MKKINLPYGWPFFLFIFLLLVIFSVGGYFDEQDQVREQEHYCKMVALWHEYGHLSEQQQRPGWPPYKGEEICDGVR